MPGLNKTAKPFVPQKKRRQPGKVPTIRQPVLANASKRKKDSNGHRFNKLQAPFSRTSLDNTTNGISGARAPVREVTLDNTAFFRVINSIAQAAQSCTGSNLSNDEAGSDITNFVQQIFLDLKNAMAGRVSVFNDCPLFYRELYESLMPTVVGGHWQTEYRFDPNSFPPSFVTTDNVQWGVINSSGTALNGLLPITSFAPSSNADILLSSANQIWHRFYAYNHKKWTLGDRPTPFMTDPSAFCFFKSDMVVDFVASSGVASLEVPIRTTWLAGLALAVPQDNRVANFTVPIYAGPQSYMGYRILSFNTGTAGAKNQVRIQRLDIAELMVQAWGVIKGSNYAYSETNALGNVVVPPFPATEYYDLFEIFCRTVVAISAFNESAMTLGYQDPYNTFQALPWGNQFLMPNTSLTSTYNMFELFVENLRRLKMVGQKYFGVPTYIVNVFVSSNIDTPYYQFTGRATPTTFSWLTMTNTGTTFYNYNDYGGSSAPNSYSTFVDRWLNLQQAGQLYTKYSNTTPMAETAADGARTPVQQVTWFLRCIYPAVSTLSMKSDVQPEWKRKFVNAISERWVAGSERRKPMPNFSMATNIGASAAIIYRRPYTGAQAAYLSLVLPTSYSDPNSATIAQSISLPVSRLMGTSFFLANNGTNIYFDLINQVGLTYAHAITNSVTPTELMQVMKNNNDLGLGGAVGDIFGWIARRIGKKHPKAAKILGGVGTGADALLGMTRFGTLNGEIGDLTSKYLDH